MGPIESFFCYFSTRFRNEPFQIEDEIFEFFEFRSLFSLLSISNARHGILKVLRKCLLNESVKKYVYMVFVLPR